MKKIILIATLVLGCFSMNAQVGIGTRNPQGLLEIKNTNHKKEGLVIPIVDNADNTRTPLNTVAVEATVVYDSIKQCLRIRTGSRWSDCLADTGTVDDLISVNTFKNYWLTPKFTDEQDRLLHNKVSTGFGGVVFSSIQSQRKLAVAGLNYIIGFGNSGDITSPAVLGFNSEPLDMATGYDNRVIITTNNEIFVTGRNVYGDLGTGDTTWQYYWRKVTLPGLATGEKPIQVQKGSAYTIILTSLGNVYAAGYGGRGHIGDGTVTGSSTFKKIVALSNIVSIWGGNEREDAYFMFTAIDNTGKVFAWGHHFYSGVQGLTAQDAFILSPSDITSHFNNATSGGAKVKKVMIGNYSLFALMTDGTLWASTAIGIAKTYIGLGAAASTTNALVNITTNVKPLLGNQDILDFDSAYLGTVVISKNYQVSTGINYYLRFGHGAVNQVFDVWTINGGSLFDGLIELTKADLGSGTLHITTSTDSTNGSGRIISSGYTGYKSTGEEPATTGAYKTSNWSKFSL
ncbi:MAG: hypothetical protein ACOVQ2_03595 [Flavobacterium sp.]